MADIKIALISDIHYGPDRGTKRGSSAKDLLSQFCDFVAREKPDFTLELGDRTSDDPNRSPKDVMADIAQNLRQIPGAHYHLIGNHDLDGMTVAENEELLGSHLASWSMNKNGFHFVFWNADVSLDGDKGMSLDPKNLAWLEADLDAAPLPTIVFSHVPLSNGAKQGNYYFEHKYPHHYSFPEPELKKVTDTLRKSGKVTLCMNGHTHWNAFHSFDGMHFVSVPSLTEGFASWPQPQGAWAMLRIGKDITIDIFGSEPMSYRLPIKTLGSHWLDVLVK